MSEQFDSQAAALDSGFGAVLMLLRFHGIGADLGQIRHRFGGVVDGPERIDRNDVRPRPASSTGSMPGGSPTL